MAPLLGGVTPGSSASLATVSECGTFNTLGAGLRLFNISAAYLIGDRRAAREPGKVWMDAPDPVS
jgi:hypothetical protein